MNGVCRLVGDTFPPKVGPNEEENVENELGRRGPIPTPDIPDQFISND